MKINDIKTVLAEHPESVFRAGNRDVIVLGFEQVTNTWRHTKAVTKVRVAGIDDDGKPSPWTQMLMPGQVEYVRFSTTAAWVDYRRKVKEGDAAREAERKDNIAALSMMLNGEIRAGIADRLGIDPSCVSIGWDKVTVTIPGVRAVALAERAIA